MSRNNRYQDREDLELLRDMIDAVRAEEPAEEDYTAARRGLLNQLETYPKENPIMSFVRRTLEAKVRLVVVTSVALLIIAGIAILQPAGHSPSQAYAAVVQQLRNALTVSFSAAWYFDDNEPATKIEMAYREPGLQRIVMTLNESKTIQVCDTEQDKGILLVPDVKGYINMDLKQMPTTEMDRVHLVQMINQDFRSLPEQAKEILDEQVVEGRKVQGFRVGNQTLWIDVEKQQLVYVEKPLGGTRMVMADFQIDSPELTDEMFSIEPPEGYTPIAREAAKFDSSGAGEQDLIDYLRFLGTMKRDQLFPATVNPLEVLELEKKGQLKTLEFPSPEKEQEHIQAYTRACQRSMMFVTRMQPVNDWHYVGKGIEYGDADSIVAYWKPVDSKKYRVVWGNLSASDLSLEEIQQRLK